MLQCLIEVDEDTCSNFFSTSASVKGREHVFTKLVLAGPKLLLREAESSSLREMT